MSATPSIIALIPARSGSKRLIDKNIRPLMGHPCMAYTICAARLSGVFDQVHVSTDSEHYAEIARHYGAEVIMRPAELSTATSPDIDWVEHALDALAARGERPDCYALLRPTSPFRLPQTIRRAWDQFSADPQVDSLRAVQKCREHPCKMWVIRGNRMSPLIPFGPAEQPWHSSQYPTLPEVYVQNASLEIAWTRVVRDGRTISGVSFMPFLTRDFEGVDVNDAEDWFYAEHIVAHEGARLPEIDRPAFPAS